MDAKPIKILLVEDNPGDARLLQIFLKEDDPSRFEILHLERLDKALERLSQENFDVILLDLSLPDEHGLATVGRTHAAAPTIPIIVLTGLNDEAVALEAVSIGAQDYLVKGSIDSQLLVRAIRYGIERGQLLTRLEQSSEERFRNIIEKSADGMVVVDKKGLVRFMNPAAKDIFRENEDVRVDRPFGFPISADDTNELNLNAASDEPTVVEMRVTEIQWERSPAFLASIRDITELQRIEKLKAEITERKRLDQVKDEFISTVSHELRTPITVIKGTMDNLQDGVLGPLNAKQTHALQMANKDIERLTRIINDLLDLSRLESGKITLNRTRLNPRDLIQDVSQKLQIIAKKKGILIRAEVPNEAKDLFAEEDRIFQVLNNLISNALRYSKKEVIIHAESANQNELKISVIDDGKGIDPEQCEELFNKFIQLDRTVGGSGYKGTGLGLAICKEIIEQHGGKIWVESQLGEGASFHFTLPFFEEGKTLWKNLQGDLSNASTEKKELALIALCVGTAEGTGPTLELQELTLFESFLREHILRKDDKIYRYPQNDNIFISAVTDAEGAHSIGKRIIKSLEKEKPPGLAPLLSQLQIGIAYYPKDGTDSKLLVEVTLKNLKKYLGENL